MNFIGLRTEVQSWLLDLPSGATSRVPGWVNEAVNDACKRYNFAFMKDEASAETADLTRELMVKPERWKENRALPYLVWQDGSTSEIDWASGRSDMVRTFGEDLPAEGNASPPDSGKPRYLLERPDTIDVYPLPDKLSLWNDGNYRVRIPYWRYPAALVADTDENWLTREAPYYVIYKAVSYGFKWNRDEERGKFYEADANIEFKRIERQDKLARLPDRINLTVSRDAYAGRSRLGLRG